MSLSKTLEEIKKVIPVANEDLTKGPIETMAGRRGRKVQAMESLKRLRREYTSELMRTAVFIVLTGSDREEFERVATEKFGVFKADSEEFYNDLARRVPSALYLGKESVSNVFDVLGRHLEDKANDMDIIGYPQLIFKQQYRSSIKTESDFRALVRRAINEQMGSEIVGIQAVRSLVDLAIEHGHTGKTTPIILSVKDDDMVEALMKDLPRINPKVFLVVAGKSTKTVRAMDDLISSKDASESSVESALTKIKNSLKTK